MRLSLRPTRGVIPARAFSKVVRLGIGLALSTSAANWPAWRGPDGSGLSIEKDLPLHWNTNENVCWRVPLPDRGNSTPVVWRERVFITQAINSQSRRTVMCLDKRTGSLL